jgi:hypothetical protein
MATRLKESMRSWSAWAGPAPSWRASSQGRPQWSGWSATGPQQGEFGLTAARRLRYVTRLELMQDNSIDTIVPQRAPGQRCRSALRRVPARPGWAAPASTGRAALALLPTDFRIRSTLAEKYGAKQIPDDMTIRTGVQL